MKPVKEAGQSAIQVIGISKLQELVPGYIKADGFFLNTVTGFKIAHTNPYRTTFYGIGLVHRGKMSLYTDLDENLVDGYSLIAMGPDVIKQWKPLQKDFLIETVFFTDDFIQSNITDALFFKQFDFFNCHGNHVFPLNEIDFERLKNIFFQIGVINDGTHPERMHIIRQYINILIYEAKALNAEAVSDQVKKSGSEPTVVYNFKQLLTRHFREQRNVQFYADQLFLNARYLSQTLKKETGKTAKDWINDMVILEARVLLQNKFLNISQITYELNFTDPSTFGKFFKTYTGKSPMEYREIIWK